MQEVARVKMVGKEGCMSKWRVCSLLNVLIWIWEQEISTNKTATTKTRGTGQTNWNRRLLGYQSASLWPPLWPYSEMFWPSLSVTLRTWCRGIEMNRQPKQEETSVEYYPFPAGPSKHKLKSHACLGELILLICIYPNADFSLKPSRRSLLIRS